jgi:uncharacterized protein with beta-barrel porin domain
MRSYVFRAGLCIATALGALVTFPTFTPAYAADFTVPAGTTDTDEKVLTGAETGTVESGGILSVTGDPAITWEGASTGVTVDNYGTIESPNDRAIDTDGASGIFTLNNYAGALISAESDAFRIDDPIGSGTVTINNFGTILSEDSQAFDFASNTSDDSTLIVTNGATGIIRAEKSDAIRPGLGTITIDNSGLIEGADRAINIEDGDLDDLISFKVYNRLDGEIHGASADAIRITGDDGEGSTEAEILIDNAGLISAVDGQAIDFDDLESDDATISIINRETGSIKATESDAVRPGEGATVTNYGTITSYDTVGSGKGSDAVDLQEHTATINNMASGVISGFRHGITTDTDLTVTNYGTITGRNGSGVGSDGDGTVINYGTITGAYAGVNEGDGDGVDIDFSGYIENYGTIQGTGADGVDNNSEGIAMGGGIIKNFAGAVISGASRGILIDDSDKGAAYGSVSIENAGMIVGYGSDAITVIGDLDDELFNSGTIIGNIDLGGGENTLDNEAGGLLQVGSMLAVGAGNSVSNAGTIAPGGSGSIETTMLTGGLAQTSSGALAIDLDTVTSTADLIEVTETATLAGSVMLAVSDLAISSGTVTVLTATGGVTALDLGLIASPALQASLAYPNANDVQISYAVSFAPAGIGLNANQSALGTHLNDAVLADPTSLADITSALLTVTTDEDYFSALDQLSPEPYGDAAVSTLNGAHTFGNALMSCRKRDAAYVGVSEGECLWAAASGRIYEQDATASGLGYEEDTWGVAGGGQVSIAPGLVLGLAGGYERSDADTTTGASTETDRGYAGAVLKHTSGRWLVAGAAFGGWSATETTRPIAIGPLATTATGEQDVPHLSGRLRVAYQAGGNAFYAKPMVDLEVTHLWFGSVREQGSPAALSIASSEETFFSAAPAIEFGGEVPLADGAVLLPFVRAGAIFYSEDSLAFSSAFAGAPSGVSSFLTQSEVDDVMGSVGAGLEVMWTDASVLKLYYDGAFGSDTRLHGFGGKASVKF